MYIVIIGCGRIGSTLALELSNEGHDVVIIDKENSKLDTLGSGFNGTRIRGVEFDNDVLLEAGIEQAQVFLAMTPDDNVNLMAAQVAHRILGVIRVIARVCYPQKQFLYDQLGLETICPTSVASQMTKEMLLHENYQLLNRVQDELEVVEFIYLNAKSFTIKEINDRYHVVVVGLIRNSQVQLAKEKQNVQKGDRLIVSVMKSDREALIKALGR
jgi:trk system potassium uptake protein TrkA